MSCMFGFFFLKLHDAAESVGCPPQYSYQNTSCAPVLRDGIEKVQLVTTTLTNYEHNDMLKETDDEEHQPTLKSHSRVYGHHHPVLEPLQQSMNEGVDQCTLERLGLNAR